MKKYLKMYGASGIFESEVISQAETNNTLISRLLNKDGKLSGIFKRHFQNRL